MAVEIRILSARRQGERLLLEGRELPWAATATARSCSTPRDPAVGGHSAVIHLSDNGWCLHATGGQVWVNQQPVARSTRLRSGDIVRMSESGPDFSFGIVAAAAPWWTGPVDVPGHGGVLSGTAAAAQPNVGVKTPSSSQPYLCRRGAPPAYVPSWNRKRQRETNLLPTRPQQRPPKVGSRLTAGGTRPATAGDGLFGCWPERRRVIVLLIAMARVPAHDCG